MRRGGGGVRQAASNPRHEPSRSSTSSATPCCCATSEDCRTSDRPRRSAGLRCEVPAGHRAGHGQGRRGHRVLRLQPAASASTRSAAIPSTSACPPERVPPASAQARRQLWPGSGLSATSTHDTKRSEDVRARIHVLSEMPQEWRAAVRRWHRWNRRAARHRRGPARRPTATTSTCSTRRWSAPGPPSRSDAERLPGLHGAHPGRTWSRPTKEAKVHTSWINPNEAYDEALRAVRRPRPRAPPPAIGSWPTSPSSTSPSPGLAW